MSNLGIATEESSKAINKLSDGLQGIPTTLDAGALAVQRFTSKNGDVNKSVDLFLAVNNALLAGGASAGIQESALEQLSQAYAKGKPDMMEWRSIQTAMPAQLKQIAKAMLGNENAIDSFLKKANDYASKNPLSSTAKELIEQLEDVKKGSGDMTTALGTALRTGIISMDEFMSTVIKLNKEGTGEFQSFEEQAKNSTGGIKTSITNAKTAITRGVANIIDAVDKALKKTELQGLGNMISKIGKTAEKALKQVANAISKMDLNEIIKRIKNIVIIYGEKLKKLISEIIKLITNLWGIIQRNKSAIIALTSVVLGLVVAFKTYQTVMKAIQVMNMAKSFISMINPIGLIVAGITALTVAVAASAIAISNQRRSMGGLREEAQAQQTTWANLKKAREDSLERSSTEIATTQKLADELREITEENGKVKEGYENRAKYILGELNKALGTEYEMNGNIITQYEDLKNNIDRLILSKKAEATLNAYKSEYETAITKQGEATKTLTELRKKYNEELNKSTHGYKEEAEKQRNLDYIAGQLRKQTDLISEYGYTIQNYEKLTSASVSGNAKEINKAIHDMGISYDQAKEKTNTSLTEQIKSQTNYVNLLNESWQNATKSNDTFQSQILETQMQTQQKELNNLATSLAQQTSTVEELSEEQKKAWSDLANENIIAYNEGLSSLDEDTKKKVEQATGIVVEEVDFPDGTKSLARRAAEGFKLNFNPDGTVSSKIADTSTTLRNDSTVKDGSKKLADKANDGFNDNVDGKKWGGDLVQNIVSGLWNMTTIGKITNASKSIAGLISDYLHHTTPEKGPLKNDDKWMSDFIDNMANGIDKNKSKVLRAVQGLSMDMERKLQNVVNFEMGKMNATATVRSNSMYNSVIQINAKFDGSVDMDSTKVGRIVAPSVTKTLKAGGVA